MTQNLHVTIVGSGIVGATAALALAKNPALQITLIESQQELPAWKEGDYDHRVSAISLASQRIFKNLAVWTSIHEKRVSPYSQMHVWDEAGSGQIHFDCHDVNEAVLGYIIEDSVMRASLHDKISQTPTIQLLQPIKLISLSKKSDCIVLNTDDGKAISTQLLIAADGANSWVREQVGFELTTHDYEQTAIVATLTTEKPHATTAWQRFLSTGPLALLPFSDPQVCSMVWSATHAYAQELMQLSDEEFCQRASTAFANKLGRITSATKRYHFPLRMRHAKQYVQNRIALIGDAAHTIHPLAGQGVNLGLLDAVCLAEVINTAVEKGRDYSSLPTLRRYERWRKSDNLAMLTAVDLIKKIFIQPNAAIKYLRNTALDTTNYFSPLKYFFTQYALGNRRDLPRLAVD